MSESAALPSAPPDRAGLGWLHWSAVGMVGLFAASYCVLAWRNWQNNPDLTHGFITPFASAFLFWQCRRGTLRWLHPGAPRMLLTAAALLASWLALAVTGLLAASLEWSHSVVNFTLAGSLCLFLGAVLCLLAAKEVRALPLNWISLAAIGLWLLSAPLPPGAYARLTLQLQGMVTTFVLQSLHLLGIPASQQGNIIQLAATSVGVEDACSGIRSLLSCTYAGLFFSAWLVHRPGRRATLLLLAPLLAVGMNFLRSLTLTLLANSGVSITGFWHDATGYAILGFTSVGLPQARRAAWPGARAPPM
jgi:exosortase